MSGTWIPVARGVELAQQYNVFGILRPLLEIVPGEGSPPPAPKHITAAPVRNKKKLQELGNGHPGKGMPVLAPPAPIGTGYTLPIHMPVQGPTSVAMTPTLASMMMSRDPSSGQAAPEGDAPRLADEEDENFSPSPSEKSSSSRTPSPIAPTDHMMGSLNDHMQMQGFYGASEEYALAGGNTLNTGTKRKAEDIDQSGNGMGGQPSTSRQRVGGAGQNIMVNPGMSVSRIPPETSSELMYCIISNSTPLPYHRKYMATSSWTTLSRKRHVYPNASSTLRQTLIQISQSTMMDTPLYIGRVQWADYGLSSCYFPPAPISSA